MKKSCASVRAIPGAIVVWAASSLATHAQILGVRWDFDNSLVYRVDQTTGAATLIGPSGVARLNSLAQNSTGEFYSAGRTGSEVLVRIDPRTGLASTVAAIPGVDLRGLAFAPDDTLYGIRNVGQGVINRLVTIDVTTGAVTTIGETGLRGIQALEFSPTGVLYGWDVGFGSSIAGLELVTIDVTTGAATDVSSSTNAAFNPVQGLAFSPDGTLYGAETSLYAIDVTTGQLTLVGPTGTDDLRGIAFLPIPEPATLTIMALGPLVTLLHGGCRTGWRLPRSSSARFAARSSSR